MGTSRGYLSVVGASRRYLGVGVLGIFHNLQFVVVQSEIIRL